MLHTNNEYSPNTIYIHEKRLPDCPDKNLTPLYYLPILLGLLLPLVIIGLLILLDRARLPPVVRARFQSINRLKEFEDMAHSAINMYTQLNKN